MVDHNLLVTERLMSSSSLVALLGSFGVVGGELPEKFDPENSPSTSPCVVVCAEGTPDLYEEAVVLRARMKVRVWCGINQFLKAKQVDAEVFKSLASVNNVQLADGFILISRISVIGQDVTDPDTGWATVLSYYEVTARE